MFDRTTHKKGTTRKLRAVFVDDDENLKTGLSVAVRIRRETDGQYLQNDGSWAATPAADYAATEVSAAHEPGVYAFSFALPDVLDEYLVRFDGSGDAANRYQFAWIEAISIGEADLATVSAVSLGGRTTPMNIEVKPALVGTGADQAVEIPRGHALCIQADGPVELRDKIDGDKHTIPAGVHFSTPPSLGQTVYLRAAVGTTIELALA